MSSLLQYDLFDADRAIELRNQGMAATLQASPSEWKEKVEAAILQFAEAGRPFLSDDVRRVTGDPPEHVAANSMGAIFAGMAKRGYIRVHGYTKSERVVGHGNLVRLWIGARCAACGDIHPGEECAECVH